MSDTPQFSTAEYLPPKIERCGLCRNPLASEYYRVHGQTACASCAAATQNGQAKAGVKVLIKERVPLAKDVVRWLRAPHHEVEVLQALISRPAWIPRRCLRRG